MTTYYHGGPRGFREIKPRSLTRVKGQNLYGNAVAKPNKVYVTTDKTAAMMYASGFKKGSVYTVKPMGKLEHDPDCSEVGLSFECDLAVVLHEEKLPPSVAWQIRDALLS